MKAIIWTALKPGDIVNHLRYGRCTVVELRAGKGSLVLEPIDARGKALLRTDHASCGIASPRFEEIDITVLRDEVEPEKGA